MTLMLVLNITARSGFLKERLLKLLCSELGHRNAEDLTLSGGEQHLSRNDIVSSPAIVCTREYG